MLITIYEVENIYFPGKVDDVVVVVGVLVSTLLVAIIIVVLCCWICKFKSKEDALTSMSGMNFKCGCFCFLNLNKMMTCFARKFTWLLGENNESFIINIPLL